MKNKFIVNTAPAALFASLTFFSFYAFELYFTNKEELWFSFYDILLPFLLITICVAAILVGLAGLAGKVSKTTGNIIISLIFSLGLGFYLQGNFIAANYGVLDGKTINWSDHIGIMILSVIVWLICFILPFILLYKRPKWFEILVRKGSCFIIGIEIITVAVLFITVGPTKDSKPIFTAENQFNISKEKNVIVFIADMLDSSYADEMLKTYQELGREFKDFTYYSDTSGAYTTTKGSLPFILTGEIYLNKQKYQDYLEQAYKYSSILKTAKENGYECDLYTDSVFAANSAENIITNLHSLKTKISNIIGFLKDYMQLISFRCMPDVLKSIFWASGNKLDSYRKVDYRFPVYSKDNYSFYRDLKKGLLANRQQPVLKVYHIQGAHLPLKIDENANQVKPHTSFVKAAGGVFRIIGEYISQLKTLGLYDNSFIVIMADHGEAFAQCPTLMIKERGAEHEELTIDPTPTSYVLNWQDIMAAVLNGKQNNIHDIIISGQKQTRPFYFYTWDDIWDARYLPSIYEYQIPSAARQMSVANQTGKIYKRPLEHKYQYKLGEKISGGDKNFYQDAVSEGGALIGKQIYLGNYTKIDMFLDKAPKSNLKMRMSIATVNGYSQKLAFRVNGVPVDSGSPIYLGEQVHEWIIPKKALSGKRMLLEFDCPDAAETNNVANKVALAFSELLIDETEDEQIVAKVSLPPLEDKIQINMGNAKAADNALLVRGMYYNAVPSGCAWTAEKATFSFIAPPAATAATFTIKYGTYYKDLDAIVAINGHEVGRMNKQHATETFKLPASYFKPDGLQTVEVSVPNATSPLLYGYGPSKRVLGLCVTNIEIAPVIKE